MAVQRPSGTPDKEVISSSSTRPTAPQRPGKVNSRIRNALLLAGGLAVGGSIPAAMAGCGTPESETGERTGKTSEALTASVAWNTPTQPGFGNTVGYINDKPVVQRSGSDIKVVWQKSQNGVPNSMDIWVTGSNDGGSTWLNPAPMAVGYSGAGTAINEAGKNDGAPTICFDATYCGSGNKMFMSKVNKLQMCDWDNTLNQGGNCQTVGSAINKIGATVFASQVDNGYLYYSANNPVQTDIYKTPLSALPLAAGTPIPSLNTGMNDDAVWLNGSYGIVTTEGQAGNLGLTDMYAFDWDGVTATGMVNMNIIPSSMSPNTSGIEGVATVDSAGDLWYSKDGVVQWATAKSVVLPDGGTDGGDADAGVDSGTDGGDADAGVDSGTDGGDADAGVDSGTDGGDADAGVDSGTDGGDADAGVDSGTDAGTDSGAGGSDGGTDAGAGGDSGSGGSDAGAGGDTGTGGSGGDAGVDCFAKATANAANFKVDICNTTAVSAHVIAPTTFQIGNKTCTVAEGNGTMDFALPNLMQFSEGIAYECGEPQTEADKIISNEHGITLGFVGTKTSRTYPAALNPNKSKGVFDIVAYTTIEGSQRAYDNTCVPQNNSVEKCNPVDFTVAGAEKGVIPAGTTMYRELSTGKVVDDPSKFNTVDPVPANTDNAGCSIAQNSTREDVNATLIGLGILAAAAYARRKERKV